MPAPVPGYIRQIGGTVEKFSGRSSGKVVVESLTRRSAEPILWNSLQPRLSLIWWKSGFDFFETDLGGNKAQAVHPNRMKLGIVPPDCQARGEFHPQDLCDYDIIFIERDFLEGRLQSAIDVPMVGDDVLGLHRGVPELLQWKDDATFGLMAEGWALQALAQLQRGFGMPERQAGAPWRLSLKQVKMIEDYVLANLQYPISLADLATLTGMSIRHLSRCFRATVGRTPAQFVFDLRLHTAKMLLRVATTSITEVAMMCGFSHSQHLSNSFRRAFGVTPSEFRKGGDPR
ncbi:helix-turn-helix transcriptional regulator [Sphingomonas sp. TDK1]|uniref:helix-turn-helix transcriptional regulator n=1 Tax=Sphingomonas sp. TDK1 TaxID=453247 RepID=UPI0007D9941E|nr:helix-turn-helix transcriptional regulator [Sphingomonas sp. TDK1]OAN58474.1 hypothetical protein A7X12_05350 [Sphingomonas sp. TDK1]